MSLLTCKDFLDQLGEFLDEAVGPEVRVKLEQHACHCHSCYVMVDTTRKTIEVFKGNQPQPVPEDIRQRLWSALEHKMAAKEKH